MAIGTNYYPMIKFFRKFRQNLLTENLPERQSSKTGKPTLPAGRYFKYAIGEILLVIMGILIALQINNWNQNRLESQTIRLYLQNLKQDLNQDIENFEFIIGNHVGRFYSLQSLLELSGESKLKFLESDEVLPESRSYYPISSGNLNADLARTFVNASRPFPPLANTSTIEELKAVGLFSKISNQGIKASINNYYTMIERRLMGDHQQEQLQKGIERWSDSLIKDGFFPMDISNVQDPLKLISNNPERVAIVKSLVRQAWWISLATNDAQRRAENLIKLIDQELQKN